MRGEPTRGEPTPPADPLTWLRAHCGALPGVEEVIAWGHPNFRVGGRAFAVYEIYRGRPSIAVRAELEEQAFLIEQFGLFKTPYVGKQGWVSAWVDGPAPWELLRVLISKAHLASSRLPARKARTDAGPARKDRP